MGEILCQVKRGVDLAGIGGKMWGALPLISGCFNEAGAPCIITSGRDGTHKPGSKHYVGDALDFRALHLQHSEARQIVHMRLKERLGRDFDVLLHGSVLHFHIEYDPK